jgi:hypothetical protein
LHHGQGADADELVNQAVARYERALFHHNMAGQQRAADDDDMIAHQGIMTHMRMLHEETMGSDHGVFRRFVGTVHGAVLAKNIVVADPQPSRFIPVFQVLRGIANDASGVESIVRADGGMPGDMNVRPNEAMRAEDHVLVDHGVGADGDRGVELGFGMDDGGRVNHE